MTRHLLTVWNPSYAESIMDSHLEVLLGLAGDLAGVGQRRVPAKTAIA